MMLNLNVDSNNITLGCEMSVSVINMVPFAASVVN